MSSVWWGKGDAGKSKTSSCHYYIKGFNDDIVAFLDGQACTRAECSEGSVRPQPLPCAGRH